MNEDKLPLRMPEGKFASRRLRTLLAILGTLTLLAVAVWIWWWNQIPPDPPRISSTGVDSAVLRSIESARQAALIDKFDSASWGKLGMVLLAHRYDDEAATCFRQAQELEPKNAHWPYLLGLTSISRSPAEAIGWLELALDLASQDQKLAPIVRLRFAETLVLAGRADEAQALFRQTLDEEPRNIRARYGLAILAKDRRDDDEALRLLSPCLPSPLARKRTAIQLAAIYQRQNNHEAARRLAGVARDAPPDLPWPDPMVAEYAALEAGEQSRFLQAERLEARGKLPEALQLVREIASNAPSAHAYVAVAVLLGKTGEFEEALGVLEAALALEPNKVQAHYFLAVAHFESGEKLRVRRSDEAQEHYRSAVGAAQKCLSLKPDHGLACLYLGLAQERLGELEAAIKAYRDAVRLRPEFVEPALHLGEILVRKGERKEGIMYLKIAANLGKGDPRPKQALARISKANPE